MSQHDTLTPKRPECFDFALDFLGGSEEAALRVYIEQLETALSATQPAQAAQSTPTPEDYKAYFDRAAQGARGQQSERHLTVTTNPQGDAVLVSWQDDEHRILEVVWERKAQAAQGAGEVLTDADAIEIGKAAGLPMVPRSGEFPWAYIDNVSAAIKNAYARGQLEATAQPAPVVPQLTPEMVNAAHRYLERFKYWPGFPAEFRWHDLWAAMLTAAPTRPAQAAQQGEKA